MESNDDSIPVRKAFSAENAKDDCSISESPYQKDNKSSKTCASASYLSTRRKYLQERQLQNLLSDDFFPKYSKPDAKENQKLFLHASQILEKLNKTIVKFSETFQPDETVEVTSAQSKRTTFKEIVLYQEVLKRLLEERCVLVLKEECDICVKRTLNLISDFKHLYMNEKLKMTTMPTQACNRFISSNDISVSTVELLIKKLQIICDLHLSISGSYQKIINCFYGKLDVELYQTVLKTNRLLYKYKFSLFHWAYKCMTVLMQKLCLADPNSVSPDFLCSVLSSCRIFNTLLKNNKIRHSYLKEHDLFYKQLKSTECKEVPFTLILSYLAYFEAKVASDRIVHFLTSTCKKNQQKKNLPTAEKPLKIDCGTSDYHSATVSDMDSEKSLFKTHDSANRHKSFQNLLTAIMQRNQSLILKYVYATANSSNRAKRRPSCETNSNIVSVRQLWNVPVQNSSDTSDLEESFWLQFWSYVEMLVLKILYEVPHHQYGDSAAGPIQMWPDAYVDTLLDCLKSSGLNNDITDEGKYTLKQIYEYVLVYKIHALWDKEFQLSLTSIFSHRYTLVPTSANQIKTLPGSLFYSCMDTLLGIFSVDFQNMDLLLFLQCFLRLHSTLDSFLLWISCRSRAVLASQNLSAYLIISCSDSKSASKLLQTKTAVLVKNADSFTRIPALRFQKEKVFWKQMDILKGGVSEAPHLVYKACFSVIKEDLLLAIHEQTQKKCTCFAGNLPRFSATEELLHSLRDAVNFLDPLPLLTAIATSVAHALLFVFNHLNKSINVKLIEFFESEFSKFSHWLDKLDVAEDDKLQLHNLHCLRKVEAILKFLQAPRSSAFSVFSRNRVAPTGVQVSGDILSDVEKQYWRSVMSRNILLSLF